MPLTSNTRHPASHAIPRGPAATPEPASHSVFRMAPSETTATSTSIAEPSDRWARLSRPTSPPSRAVTLTPHRRSTRCLRCSRSATAPITPPSAPTSGAGPRSATVTSRPCSRQAEATSEPVKPAPITNTRRTPPASFRYRRAESSRVRSTNTPSRAASSGWIQGRALVPVVISRRSYGTVSPFARRTCLAFRSRPSAVTPRRHSASMSRRRGSAVSSGRARPSSACLDSGGRS